MSTSWENVLKSCLQQVAAPGREAVSRPHALGRLLAQSITADRDYPSGHLSMMDGYAIDEIPRDSFRVEGENRPGCGPGEPLAPGSARRIFTGAELPSGATRVVPQELAERQADTLRITQYPDTNFLRERGCEARQGDPILKPGQRLTAVEISILAAIGAEQVEVTARPRVAHLVTGDEVIAPGEKVEPGPRIRDSNSDLISAVLAGVGQRVVDRRRVHDDRAAACQIVQQMAETCDVLLISGGASVGDHDHARVALESAGFHFEAHGLEVRPGKPVGLARRGDQWAIALPGNPVSHLVALHLFVLPLLLTLEGAPQTAPRFLRGTLAQEVSTKIPTRDTFWPATVEIIDGTPHLTPRRFLSSGDLLGLHCVNGLIFLKSSQPPPPPGTSLFFLSLSPIFANPLPE